MNWLSGNSYRHLWLIWVLITGFGGLYFLSYRGFPDSLDELAILSANEGWAKTGDPTLVSLYHEYRYGGNPYILEAVPWESALHENLPVMLGGLLYRMIQPIPSVGLLHSLWLTNIWVTVAILAVLAGLGVVLGYDERTSFSVALVVGVGTPLWHYSQTYFREPWAALWGLLAYGTVLYIQRQRRWVLLPLVVLWIFLALNSKIITLMLIPMLILVMLPPLKPGQYIGLGTLGLTSLIIILWAFQDIVYRGRSLSLDPDYILTVTGAYFFSFGRSLWATSPILVLAVWGLWRHLRTGDYHLALAPFFYFILLVMNYALSGRDWHGGRGWGSRYLVPVIPIMAMLLFPALEALWQKSAPHRLKWAIGGVAIFSVLVQLGGVFAPLEPYYEHISQAYPDNTLDGLYKYSFWNPLHTQWYLSLSYLPDYPLDVAWSYTQHRAGGIGLGISLILLSLIGFWYRHRLKNLHILILFPMTFTLMTIGYGLAVSQLRDDRRFPQRPELWDVVQILEAESDSLIFLSDPQYRDFFLNYYHGQARFVTLPYAPGERYSFEQAPQIITANPDERLGFQTLMPLWYGVQHFETLWLVTNTGTFQPWAYRPTEHYLARHFYPVQTWDLAADVRLIRFDTTPAIAFDYVYQTLYIPDSKPFTFGENLILRGYTFPVELQAGKVLPVSLKWVAEDSIPFDYNVGVQLLNGEGQLVAQHDGQPQGSFGYMSQWENDVPQADHHGLAVPLNLPQGRYTIQVVVYDWRDGARLGVNFSDATLAAIGTVNIVQE